VSAGGLFVDERPPEGGEGPLVVTVHGAMDRHRSFFPLRGHLRDHRVVVYDRRGYFRSRDARPPARGVADHADDLLAVLRRRPAVVVGHSYGGDVALAAAAIAAEVRAVVAVEPPLAWLPWWDPPGRPRFAGEDPGDAAEAFVRRLIGDERMKLLGEAMRLDLRADGPAFVTEMAALRRDPPPFEPEALRVPVVVVRGSESNERQRRSAAWLAERLPAGEVHVVDGATHNLHLSHPGELSDLVRRAVQLGGLSG
jgi:pimeloyl-ACP methyl ester carboxylesterase